MAKNTGKVREFCQSGKVGTLIVRPPCRQTPPLVMWPVIHAGKPTPSPREQTNICENITLPQTSFDGGNEIL